MKKKVYILGNPLLKSDNLPLNLLPALIKKCPEIKFEILDPTEGLTLDKTRNLIFIDTVLGINKVTIFDRITDFSISPRVSTHDYDLPLDLTLLIKLKKIKKVTIIGLPSEASQKQIIKDVIGILYNHFTFKK